MPEEESQQAVIPDNVLVSGLFDPRFSIPLILKFQPEWLGAEEMKLIFTEAQAFYQEFRDIPNPSSLLFYIQSKGKLPPQRLTQISDIFNDIPEITQPGFFEFQLERTLQGKILHSALRDAVALFQAGNYDEVFKLINKARSQSSLHQQQRHANYWDNWEFRAANVRGTPVPLGFPSIDNILKGGLFPGESALVIGLKSTGKSFLATWIARSALLYDQLIVVFSMEMSRTDFLRRIDCAIAEIDFDEYDERADEIKDLIMARREELLGNIEVIEYPSGYPTIGMFRNDILEVQERLGRKVNGTIIDYLNLVRGTVVGAESSARFGLISAAVEVRGMSGELDLASVILTQSNAQGKKKPFIEADNAAEAYGQAWAADFVLSINEITGRPDLRRLYIADSRRTAKKVSVLYQVDFSRGLWTEQTGF